MERQKTMDEFIIDGYEKLVLETIWRIRAVDNKSQFARSIGISRAGLYKYLNRINEPSSCTVRKMIIELNKK